MNIKNPLFLILLNSFLILYLELALIRYLPAYIYYLGYFNNFVFIAAIFGMGLGLMLASWKTNLINFFAPLLLLLILGTKFLSFGIDPSFHDFIFFKNIEQGNIVLPGFVLLPALFILVALIFTCLSQPLGRLFLKVEKPLLGYIYDLAGSLLGIFIFRIGAYLLFSPTAWFGVFTSFFFIFAFLTIKNQKWLLLTFILIFLTIPFSKEFTLDQTLWSPYYKLTLTREPDSSRRNLYTNGIGHQAFSKLSDAPFYQLIFQKIVREKAPFEDILIIGAGTGQDVAAALSYGAKRIDAVEIDPLILQIGRERHPEKPYQDQRVKAFVDDGRHFLRETDRQYDYIIFSLPDSLVANSKLGQIRLESYLFTLEALEDARGKLKEGGYFVVYNDYREDWLVQRLARMIETVFGQKPKEINFGGANRLFMVKHDPKAVVEQKELLPTDDWPFFYTRTKNIPQFYLSSLSLILLLSIIGVLIALKKVMIPQEVKLSRLMAFFFLGAAFALLETKSIAQQTLLFGWTWVVNALAFSGILVTVLLACLLIWKFRFGNNKLFFFLLSVSLIIQYFFDPNLLLSFDMFWRVVLAAAYFFSPIFFANLIFANLFLKSKVAPLELGSNLIGLVAGAIIEYSVLVFGFSPLTIMAGLFYLLAFFSLYADRLKSYLRKGAIS